MNGIAVGIGPEAVVIRSARPLLAVSSAPVGGGVARVRAVINLHVRRDDPCLDPAAMVAAFARRAGVGAPYVGLLTGAWTMRAQQAVAARYDIQALAVATVGLSNRVAAGLLAGAMRGGPPPSTRSVIVDAEADAAALVNAVITGHRGQGALAGRAGGADGRGRPVTGTSTDAVVVAATGAGPRARFGGPASEFGWVVARAAGRALEAGIAPLARGELVTQRRGPPGRSSAGAHAAMVTGALLLLTRWSSPAPRSSLTSGLGCLSRSGALPTSLSPRLPSRRRHCPGRRGQPGARRARKRAAG